MDEILIATAVVSALLGGGIGYLLGKPESPVLTGQLDSERVELTPTKAGGTIIEVSHVHERDCIVDGQWACQGCWNQGIFTAMPRAE